MKIGKQKKNRPIKNKTTNKAQVVLELNGMFASD